METSFPSEPLQKHYSVGRIATIYFASATDATLRNPDSISATVSRLCRRLGLPKGASLHVLRHSHAILLLEKGVDLATARA
jgi:site-specific recombinase XerD